MSRYRRWSSWLWAAVFLCFVLTASAYEAARQSAPAVPDRLREITVTLHQQHPELVKANDDSRRALTKMIVEQVVFEFPGQGWGWKSASATRLPSKDCIARKTSTYFYCWDWQNGSSLKPIWPFLAHDITGQTFIEVAGVNHLSPTEPDPGHSDPVDSGLSASVAELKAEVTALRQELDTLTERLAAVESRPVPQALTCGQQAVSTGRSWGHAHSVTVQVCK